MTAMTTIKVPRELRDRLAAQAEDQGVTMASVIARALDELEEQTFWLAVHRAHAGLTTADREAYLHEPVAKDGLLDERDMEISRNDAW
jgi:predicted transcriptional regulator